MWPMLAVLVVQRFGAASLVGLIEGVIVLITGIYGSHGILSLITYLTPCLIIDTTFLIMKNLNNKFTFFIPPALGNTMGSLMVAYFIMHLPRMPLLFGLIPAFIFGGIGGLLAAVFYNSLIKTFPQFSKNKKGLK